MKTRRPAMPCTLSMFLVATALAAVLGTAPPAAADGALATLTADQAGFASSESVVVRLTLANPGDAPIAVLRWLTAADGLEAPLFTVARDGTPVPYVGRIVKRPASEPVVRVPT